MSTTREQVMHKLEMVIRQAQEAGQGDGVAAARDSFPGTSDMVLYEAWVGVEMERTEEWWTAVERTIDGEIIRKSISTVGGRNDGCRPQSMAARHCPLAEVLVLAGLIAPTTLDRLETLNEWADLLPSLQAHFDAPVSAAPMVH